MDKINWEVIAIFAILSSANLALLRIIVKKREAWEFKAIMIVVFLVFVVCFINIFCVLTGQI